MKIAVLSGKGGAGKTFISTNLSRVSNNSYYLDCDIEEPNGHLFFNRENIIYKNIYKKIPSFNEKKCIKCKSCVDNCNFNAISFINNRIYIFDEMCHSCGACIYLCEEKALTYEKTNIGRIEIAKDKNTNILSGFLNIKQSSGGEIISSLMTEVKDLNNVDIIIDAPPGVDCNVMDSIYKADYCIVVAEPTIFGLENFKMVHSLLNLFNKPFGVIVNKALEEENLIEKYCKEKAIYIYKTFFFDKEISNSISNGTLLVDDRYEYKVIFEAILEDIKRRSYIETITNN